MVTKKDNDPVAVEPAYTKEQIASSNTFAPYRDVVTAFLEDDKTYTIDQVHAVIDKFKAKEVK